MAIDPNLVSIIPAGEIPTGIPTSAGQFFFYEGNEMMKAPMTEIYELVSGSQSLGTITPSSTIPAEGNVWGFAGEDTYPNAGNFTVSPNTIGILTRVGTTWSKVEVPATQNVTQNINNNTYNLEPEQIVPSEALYTDETLAGDILKRVDKTTGENVNYRETTTWHDGSAMDDSKVDGDIYLKKNNKYYQKILRAQEFVSFITSDINKLSGKKINAIVVGDANEVFSDQFNADFNFDGMNFTYITAANKSFSPKSDRIISNVKIDGNANGGGISSAYNPNITINNCVVNNVVHMGINLQTCDNSKIEFCTVTGTKQQYGDGIQLINCRNGIIRNNTIKDFTRAGIVVDWSGEYRSENPIIENNYIENGHDSLNGEWNGGIWIENCYGGTIRNNKIVNPGVKGIIVVPSGENGKQYDYYVEDNVVVGSKVSALNWAYTGIHNLFVRNFTAIDCAEPFELSGGNSVIIKDVNFIKKNEQDSYFGNLIRIIPSADVTTNTLIENLTHNINLPTGKYFIDFTGIYSGKGNYTFKNINGKVTFSLKPESVNGTILFENCKIELSEGQYISNSTIAIFKDCEIILKGNVVQNGKLIIDNCKVSSDNDTDRTIGTAYSNGIELIKSEFKNIQLVNNAPSIDIILNKIFADNSENNSKFLISNQQMNDLKIIKSAFDTSSNPQYDENAVTKVIIN